MKSNDELFSVVSTILAEALRIPKSQITMDSKILRDLGAESLDIIDVRFRLEHAFGMSLQEKEIIRSIGEGLTNSQIEDKFTVASLIEFINKRLGSERVDLISE